MDEVKNKLLELVGKSNCLIDEVMGNEKFIFLLQNINPELILGEISQQIINEATINLVRLNAFTRTNQFYNSFEGVDISNTVKQIQNRKNKDNTNINIVKKESIGIDPSKEINNHNQNDYNEDKKDNNDNNGNNAKTTEGNGDVIN